MLALRLLEVCWTFAGSCKHVGLPHLVFGKDIENDSGAFLGHSVHLTDASFSAVADLLVFHCCLSDKRVPKSSEWRVNRHQRIWYIRHRQEHHSSGMHAFSEQFVGEFC